MSEQSLVPGEAGDERRHRYLTLSCDQRLVEMRSIRLQGEEAMLRLADLIWAAREAGDDLTPYKEVWGGWVSFLLQIGARQILPIVYREYGRHYDLFRLVSKLNPADQQRVCEGPLPVFEFAADGTPTHRLMTVKQMSAEQKKQVFDGATIRSLAEQEAYLLQRQKPHKPQDRPEKFGRVRLDDAIEVVYLGNHQIPFAELADIFRECKRRGWRSR